MNESTLNIPKEDEKAVLRSIFKSLKFEEGGNEDCGKYVIK